MQHLNTARTAGMSKRCSFSQAGDDRPWLRHIRHRRSPRSTRSASTLHAGSLLALARARKASWPALKFSFLPPHALRADACKRQAAWMGIADAWAAAPATAALCCARRASGGRRTEGADAFARGTALGGRPPMKSPEQARGRIRHTTHTGGLHHATSPKHFLRHSKRQYSCTNAPAARGRRRRTGSTASSRRRTGSWPPGGRSPPPPTGRLRHRHRHAR